MSVSDKRNSKYELARIFFMFMIVINHSISHGVFEGNDILGMVSNINIPLAYFFTHFGDIGNAFFMLLTGYFCARKCSETINWKAIVKIILQMEFYSIAIMTVLMSFSLYQFQFKDILKSIFPVLFGLNWYFCCFVIVSLIMPIIIKTTYAFDSHRYATVLIVIFLLKFVLPLFGVRTFLPFNHDVPQFILMVLIGGAIYRLINEDSIKLKKSLVLVFLIIQIMLMLCACFLLYYVEKKDLIGLSISPDYFRLLFVNTIPINAMLLLETEEKASVSNVINKIASCVPGVYLIHDNRFLRALLWQSNISHFLDTDFYIYIALKCFFIFGICVFIEFVRQILFNTIENRITRRIVIQIEKICISVNCRKTQLENEKGD